MSAARLSDGPSDWHSDSDEMPLDARHSLHSAPAGQGEEDGEEASNDEVLLL